ncbi:hypothetical protein DAPPUDRAFT_305110 [Daphnia pulex]|uniref:Uncharacterized protein n=1 Tax=Daphnia pulex TaxID=6669 RepID=E9GNY9_DAPPU|nr:hypothetical protein DAPPUDRAFT_305110 [Daphnia pulex]|eukprot:EFX78860.1 hypothetical protein DAPPUDRAFT_305110 [Daphnia pulex]
MDDITDGAKSLSIAPIKKEEEGNSEENTEPIPEVNPNAPIIVSGKAYTVAGKRSDIEEIIGNYGSEIIGGFHKTIDGGRGICYIRMPKAESEQKTMLEKFNRKNILVWREKEVKQSTNGYELDLAIEEHLQFVIDNIDRIKFFRSPEIENNSEESNNSAKISYVLPKGCYCMPNGNPVGTPNKCKMGVKIDTVNTNKKNNKQIYKKDLEIIITNHLERTEENINPRLKPKQESKEIKTEKK